MKKQFLITTIFIFFAFALAEAQISSGDYIYGAFESPLNTTKSYNSATYVAEVISVSGTSFTCKFVHSGSVYQFKNFADQVDFSVAEVKSTDKGIFKKEGTPFYFSTYTPATESCNYLKVTFADGKSYFAEATTVADGNYQLIFWHSGSKYLISPEGIILQSGGSYRKGQKVTWKCYKPLK